MRYENWRKENNPIAAFASNITEDLVLLAPLGMSFAMLCDMHHHDASPGEVCEALALAYVCRQVVPENGEWRASRAEDFASPIDGGAKGAAVS